MPRQWAGSVLQSVVVVGVRESSPVLMSTGPTLPSASGVDDRSGGGEAGGQLSPTYVTTRQMNDVDNSLMFITLGQTYPYPH